MNKGKVYELNGAEQSILEKECRSMQRKTKLKIMKQDAVKQCKETIEVLEREIQEHNVDNRRVISHLADKFGLTRLQVISKILAENKRN